MLFTMVFECSRCGKVFEGDDVLSSDEQPYYTKEPVAHICTRSTNFRGIAKQVGWNLIPEVL